MWGDSHVIDDYSHVTDDYQSRNYVIDVPNQPLFDSHENVPVFIDGIISQFFKPG